jgi:hypothetical protein
METYQKLLSNHGPNLRDFMYKLALGLIESSSDPCFQNVLSSQTNNNTFDANEGIQHDPATLQCRLNQCTWPKQFKLNKFSTDATLIKLRLMANAEFEHKCEMKLTTG